MIKGQKGERVLVLEVEVGTEKRLGTFGLSFVL